MKTIKLFLLTVSNICLMVGYAQPGESDKKHNIYEIKLEERDDGSKIGAITSFTPSPDSIQKFVIRGLSIMEPVQILLQSYSATDEVKLHFVKEKWSEPESHIRSKGKILGKKLFRTYKTAAMYIKADKPNIPYMLLAQVGQKLPTGTTPLVRITNDRKEFEAYLESSRIQPGTTTGANQGNKTATGSQSGLTEDAGNSTLLYIIIGLLSAMVALLAYLVVFRKRGGKTTLLSLLMVLSSGLTQAQFEAPPISTPDINNLLGLDDPFENSEPSVDIVEYGSQEYYDEMWGGDGHAIPIEGGPEPITEDEWKEMVINMREEFQAFREEFVDGMPGENTEGGHRVIPPEVTREEMDRLRRRTRELEAQVEYLSNRDREYEPDNWEDEEPELAYCDESEQCVKCIQYYNEYANEIREDFRELNRIMVKNDWEMEVAIDMGNNMANMAPGFALGWQRQYIQIQKSRKQLWKNYHSKYAELLDEIENLVDKYQWCADTYGTALRDDWWLYFKEELRRETPELVTPML
ncbi:MAG: hypothetical protein AB3N14_10055 [Flavobacteriaceae bacterium]